MTQPFDHAARFVDIAAPGRFEAAQVVRDLGDGLILRRASVRDADALDDFNRVVHADPPDFADIDGIGGWARDLVGGGHPSVRAEDFWLVEDTEAGRLASSLGLIPHRMHYDGIGFDAGQVELVGTHPDYRHRGLVRAQMELVHEASAERGHALQFEGVRNVVRSETSERATRFEARRDAQRWRGRAEIDAALLPAGLDRVNAYAIHGDAHARRYLAAFPAAGSAPDFHQLKAFAPLDWSALRVRRSAQ